MSLFQRLNQTKSQQDLFTSVGGKGQDVVVTKERKVNQLGNYSLLTEMIFGDLGCSHSMQQLYRHSKLGQNLQLLGGIGPSKMDKIKGEGYETIEDLRCHSQFKREAEMVFKLIELKAIKQLRRRGASDSQLLTMFKPQELVFLDIEATSLYPNQPLFLVGIMYCSSVSAQGMEFKIQQYLGEAPAEEGALLLDLGQTLREFQAVVTYNGNKYDLPYIQERWKAHKIEGKMPGLAVDLLLQARRRYKGILPNCKLQTLEQELLGFKRQGDIPGYIIPRAYYDYVNRGNQDVMDKILYHNRLDLIYMVKLLQKLFN
ncbi:hypothetical protein GGQ84_000605 [Desulfitispora alkaliphila]|uniref:ribonuclease H-like domain-containing protein n=1 Tax=Desulfitispora alkaliphila TaxID=622674 RepID=UPI003D205237